MLCVGDSAPEFSLPGYHEGEFGTFSLSDALGAGKDVLVTFYPGDFSPTCVEQLCDYRDADWYTYKTDLQVFAISRDNVYSHKEFAEQNDLTFPLLSDVSGEVCGAYGALVDEFEGMADVPRRSVFLIDDDGTVQFAWQTDDNWEKPETNPVKKAIEELD